MFEKIEIESRNTDAVFLGEYISWKVMAGCSECGKNQEEMFIIIKNLPYCKRCFDRKRVFA